MNRILNFVQHTKDHSNNDHDNKPINLDQRAHTFLLASRRKSRSAVQLYKLLFASGINIQFQLDHESRRANSNKNNISKDLTPRKSSNGEKIDSSNYRIQIHFNKIN